MQSAKKENKPELVPPQLDDLLKGLNPKQKSQLRNLFYKQEEQHVQLRAELLDKKKMIGALLGDFHELQLDLIKHRQIIYVQNQLLDDIMVNQVRNLRPNTYAMLVQLRKYNEHFATPCN